MARRLALPALLIAVALTGCATPAANPATPGATPARTRVATPASATPAQSPIAEYPLTLTDDAGREVTIEAEPIRLVSLAPSNTEIVCALDACDLLVGVTDFDDYPPEVIDVEDVVIAAQVDVEKVVAAEPDLVLAAGNELTPSSVIDQIAGLGLVVLVLYPESLDEVEADIELVGRALGRTTEAASLVDEMNDRAAAVMDAVDGVERPRTLYEVFWAEGTTYTAGEGSFIASLLELAGATPITGDVEGVLEAEELVAADPELILLGTATYDPSLADAETALQTVAARPGWADLTAVRDGHVLPYLDDIVTTRPGPRIVEGLEALARAIHPDRFD